MKSHEINIVVFVKAISLFMVAFGAVFANTICSCLLFNTDISFMVQVIIASIPVCIIASMMVMLIGIIRIYFDRNRNILSALIFPFLIPAFILYGLYFESSDNTYLYLLLGISLILMPLIVYLVSILLKELYNS
jgi:hypothetical protein